MSRFRSSPIFAPSEFSFDGELIFWSSCLAISLILIARIWIFHRKDSLKKKLMWSAILMLPVLGWVLYGAFYNTLGDN
jgi:hypothetical protein